jgi:hypothetical protein
MDAVLHAARAKAVQGNYGRLIRRTAELKMEKQSGIGDFLGIRPVGEAVKKVTDASVDGAAAFLSRICLPAAEEFGLLLRDRVRYWRSQNIASILARTQDKLAASHEDDLSAHPRIVSQIVENGSWIDDSVVQDMWAGLLSSSCTEVGDDDSNLLFTNLLASLSGLQARILKHACETCEKELHANELVTARDFTVPRLSADELISMTGESDLHRLDREMDHLRELGLLSDYSGFDVHATPATAQLTPSAIALHMYVRCQGSRMTPQEYFDLKPAEVSQATGEVEEVFSEISDV